MTKVLNDQNFESETNKGIVLVDFYADWCGPCNAVAPIIDELSNELTNSKIVKVNVDESPELASKFQVRSIPTFVVLKNGEEANRTSGARTKDFYLNLINEANL